MNINFIEFVGFKNSSKVRATLNSVEYHQYHAHKNILEIICVLDGNIKISDGALDRNLSSGDVYIFNAQDSHRISSQFPNILLTLHIDQTYYSQFFNNLKEFYFLCDSYNSKEKNANHLYHLRFLMSIIYVEYEKNIFSDRRLEENTCALIQLLLDKFQYYIFKKMSPGTYDLKQIQVAATENNMISRVYNIINYIFNNFNLKLRLEDIAAKEYLSIPYLSTSIKNISGLTFGELLSLARSEETERLLMNRHHSIDEIANLVGFASRSHLASNFKKWYGKTPSEYRKKITSGSKNEHKKTEKSFDKNFALLIIREYLNGNFV